MKISIFLLALASTQPVCARTNESRRTVSYVRVFSNVVTRRNGQATDATVQTVNIAREHRVMWRDWKRTGRWPHILNNNVSYSHSHSEIKWRPKPNATSAVRVSWYYAENAAFNIEIDNNGRSGIFSTTYLEYAGGSVARFYKPREMGSIARLISELPTSTKVTDFRDVLMISGRHNGRWIMRMYSRHRKPLAVRRLLWAITPSSLQKDRKHLSPLAPPGSLKR